MQVFLQVFFLKFNNFCNWLIIDYETENNIYEIVLKTPPENRPEVNFVVDFKIFCGRLGVERNFFYI